MLIIFSIITHPFGVIIPIYGNLHLANNNTVVEVIFVGFWKTKVMGNSWNQQSQLSLSDISRGAPLDFMEIPLYQGKILGPTMLTFLAKPVNSVAWWSIWGRPMTTMGWLRWMFDDFCIFLTQDKINLKLRNEQLANWEYSEVILRRISIGYLDVSSNSLENQDGLSMSSGIKNIHRANRPIPPSKWSETRKSYVNGLV